MDLGFVGPVYFAVSLLATGLFLHRAIRTLQIQTDDAARATFRASLVFLFAVFSAMLGDLLFL